MALKPIFEIDVDDTKFKKFIELFNKYQVDLKKMPGAWNKIGEAVEKTNEEINNSSDATGQQVNAVRNIEEGQKRVTAVSKTTAVVWSSISNSVSSVSRNISSATSSLLKWSTVTAVFGGLLGAGSLFGIDRLAASVSASRRSAMGLGVSYGQQSSFNTNYSRLINAGSLLSNVAGAKYDLTSPAYTALMASGLSPDFIKKNNAASVSQEFLNKLPQLFKGVKDPGLIGATAKAYGIDQLMPMQDLIAFLNASPEERAEIAKRNSEDSKTLDLTEEAQRKWQDLTTQLSRAAGEIETNILEKFSRLAPGLDKLSESFVKAVEAFAKSDVLDRIINAIADGLNSFADQINNKEFQDGVKQWVDWIPMAAKAIWDFIGSFAESLGITPAEAATSSAASSSVNSASSLFPAVASSSPLMANSSASAAPSSRSDLEAYIRQSALSHGIDPDFAVAVAKAEGLNKFARGDNMASITDVDPNGVPFSYGAFQNNMHPGALGDIMLRKAGIDPRDPKQQKAAIDFDLQWMKDHGVGPWKGDQTVEQYRSAGRLPSIYIRPNTGNDPVLSSSLVSQPYTAVQ